MIQQLRTALGCLLLFFPATLMAQDGNHKEQITVTANRFETPLTQAGSSVLVISALEIEAMQASTLADVLKLSNGIQLLQSGGPGKTASLFIRGAQTRHALVLIDGVRVNENTAGGANIADLSLDQVDRIEIVKGAQSALYGSDAIAGVIQVFTKRPVKEGFSGVLNLQAGTKEHQRENLYLSSKQGDWDYGFSYSHYGIGDYSIAPGDEKDPFKSDSLTGRLGFALPDKKGRIDWNVRVQKNKTDLDGGWGLPEDDPDRLQKNESLITDLSWHHVFSNLYQHQLSASYVSMDATGEDNGAQWFQYKNQTTRLEYQATLQFQPAFKLVSGLSHENQAGQNAGNYEKITVTNQALYSEAIWIYKEKTQLTAGGRYDDNESFGSESTYRLTLNQGFAESTHLHASYGTGFKAPALNDLYWPSSPWSAGNPDLLAETSKGYDLGIHHAIGSLWDIDVTWFHDQVTNLIIWAPDENYVWKPMNLQESDIQGLEVSSIGRLAHFLDVNLHYTFLDAMDGTTQNRMDYRPKHQGGLALTCRFPKNTTLRLDWSHVGERLENIIEEGLTLDAYNKLDLSLDYKMNSKLRFLLHVDNLTDSDYQDYTGYGTPGRYGFAGVDFKF